MMNGEGGVNVVFGPFFFRPVSLTKVEDRVYDVIMPCRRFAHSLSFLLMLGFEVSGLGEIARMIS